MTVTCGATEAMVAAMLGLLDPGDEVVVFEPYYENYGPDAILTGAMPRYVTLHEPDWSIDPDELRAAFGPRTRAIVVNSPHNPTGKVFRRDELELIRGRGGAPGCLVVDILLAHHQHRHHQQQALHNSEVKDALVRDVPPNEARNDGGQHIA